MMGAVGVGPWLGGDGLVSADPLLVLALLWPLLSGAAILLGRGTPRRRDAITLGGALLLPLWVGALYPPLLAGARPGWLLWEWLPGLALRFEVEPLGLLLALVAALLWPINTLYAIGYLRANKEAQQTRFHLCFALALASTLCIAFAANLLTLFVGYELLTLCTYPLVTHHGDGAARRAGRVYLGVLLGASVGLLLPALLWVWQRCGSLDFVPGGILDGQFSGAALGGLLLLFLYGTAKAALLPLHRWLPAAMVAPAPVSALLHAVAVVKAGVFILLKLVLYLFGPELLLREASTHWLLYLAGFSIIAASLVALRQDNLKKRLAYSTISQLGYVVLAAAVLAPLSLAGAALHIAAHAVAKITLFFAAGAIATRAGETRISRMAGIGRRMPWTLGAFSLGALSMIGVPPAVGFWSKWYILLGAYQAGQWLALAVVLLSTLLNAAYFVPIIHTAFFRRPDPAPDPAAASAGDAPLSMRLALLASALLVLLLFLWPDPLLALIGRIPGVAVGWLP